MLKFADSVSDKKTYAGKIQKVSSARRCSEREAKERSSIGIIRSGRDVLLRVDLDHLADRPGRRPAAEATRWPIIRIHAFIFTFTQFHFHRFSCHGPGM